jgi:SH3-like domain-containing protein
MSADNSLKNWQVEDGGKGADRYALTGSQAEPPKQLQLQEDASGGSQWQPIDYRRQTGPRRNWILPSVIVVALLGVMAYVGWIAFGQVAGGNGGAGPFAAISTALSGIIGGQADTAPTPETVAAGVPMTMTVTTAAEQPTAAAATDATATPEPTATATPEPTPTPAQVELITGVVIEAAGANARREPATTAEVLRLLPQNAAVTVVAEQDGWLQVILDDNTVAWVSADLIERKSELVLLTRLNEVLTAAGLPPMTPAAPALAAVAAAPSTAPQVTLPAVVIGEPGINARNAPDLAAGVTLMTLNKDTAVNAVGRTDNSQWLAVELPEGDYGWVLTQFISTEGDVATLDVVTPEILATWVAAAAVEAAPVVSDTASSLLPAPTPSAGTTSPETPTSALALPVLEISLATPPAPFTNTLPLGPAVAISNAVGVNARATSTTDGALLLIVPDGAVLPAVGRSADGEWIQVRLPDGQLAWMARAVVNVSDNIDTTPVGGVTAGGAAPAPAANTTVTATASTAVTPTAPAILTSAGLATITNPLGANLRSVPDRNTNPVVTVKNGEKFPVLGRTADGAWVQLALPDGTTGWALVATVSLDTDVNNLPVIP